MFWTSCCLVHARMQSCRSACYVNAGGMSQSAGQQGTGAGASATTTGMGGDSVMKGLTSSRQQDSRTVSGSSASPGKHASEQESSSAGQGTGLVSQDSPKAVPGWFPPCAACTTERGLVCRNTQHVASCTAHSCFCHNGTFSSSYDALLGWDRAHTGLTTLGSPEQAASALCTTERVLYVTTPTCSIVYSPLILLSQQNLSIIM